MNMRLFPLCLVSDQLSVHRVLFFLSMTLTHMSALNIYSTLKPGYVIRKPHCKPPGGGFRAREHPLVPFRRIDSASPPWSHISELPKQWPAYSASATSNLISRLWTDNPLCASKGFDYRLPAIYGSVITNYGPHAASMDRESWPNFTPICVCVMLSQRWDHVRTFSVAISQISLLQCLLRCFSMFSVLQCQAFFLTVYFSASGSCHQLSILVGEWQPDNLPTNND